MSALAGGAAGGSHLAAPSLGHALLRSLLSLYGVFHLLVRVCKSE